MFRWKEVDQKKQIAAREETFPLNAVYPPMRMVIFQTMEMDQLVKMSFESLEAARDIRRAQIGPKTLDITIGDLRDRIVNFALNGFNCVVGTRAALGGKTTKDHSFFTTTFSGKLLNECTTDKTSLYIIVPEEGDLLEAVKNVYEFLSNLFQDAMTTNLIVLGEFAYLYPVIDEVRKFTSLNRLEICGHWGSTEDQRKIFEGILEDTTFNHLGIHDKPPVGSKPIKITADCVNFNLHNPLWLSEPRFQEVDAKKISFQSSGPSIIFAERFNLALKNWHEGTGLQRLETINVYGYEPSQMEVVKGRLPVRRWNKYRRPGYYRFHKTGENGETEFSNFHDIREADDLTNQENGLGTIIVAGRVLLFQVWTPQEIERQRGNQSL